jgi:hypothetical protein
VTTRTPTDTEKASLKRIASVRSGLPVVLFANFAAIALASVVRDGPVGSIVAGSAVLILLGTVVYISFALRCPRCSSWIPMPSSRSKCTSCGLSLGAASEEGTRSRQI